MFKLLILVMQLIRRKTSILVLLIKKTCRIHVRVYTVHPLVICGHSKIISLILPRNNTCGWLQVTVKDIIIDSIYRKVSRAIAPT
jgi:hypothetical protein